MDARRWCKPRPMALALHSISSRSRPQFFLRSYGFIPPPTCYSRGDSPDPGLATRSCDSVAHGYLEVTAWSPLSVSIGAPLQLTNPLDHGIRLPSVWDDLPKPQLPCWLIGALALRSASITQLASVNMRSKEFPKSSPKCRYPKRIRTPRFRCRATTL